MLSPRDESRRTSRQHHLLSATVLVAGMMLSALAFFAVRDNERKDVEAAFNHAATNHSMAVRQGFERSVEVVQSLGALYTASQNVTREQFSAFAKHLLKMFPGIQALEWIPRVPAEARIAHENEGKEAFPQYQITERKTQGQMVRAATRREYFPVYFVEPYAGNEAALGFDLGSNPVRLEALNRSRDSGSVAATARITLVQERADQFGFLIFLPIYRSQAPHDTVERRRDNLLGFVLGVFRLGDVVEKALSYHTPGGIESRLYDDSAPQGERLLHIHSWGDQKQRPDPNSQEAWSGHDLSKINTFDIADRHYTLLMTPTPGHYLARPSWTAWGILAAALALTALSVLYLQIVRKHAIEQIAANAVLRESEARLERAESVAHLGHWDWNIPQNQVVRSEQTYRIFGLTPQQFSATYEAFLNSVHPKDRERVSLAVTSSLQNHEPYNIDYRIVLPDGTLRFVNDQGQVELDNSGKPVRMFGVVHDITERKAAEERIQFLAYYDSLTHLPNRILLQDRIMMAFATARRSKTKVGILFLDLDHFKTVVDSLGHTVGDHLLQAVAERLKQWVRETDTVARSQATVARLGGDEFVVVLPAIKDASGIAHTAERLLTAMSQAFAVDGHALNITCSIGLSLFPDDGIDAEATLRNADTALQQAKEFGRNNYQFFTPELNARASERLSLEVSLRHALERGEFLLHYQPQVEILTGQITGVEALIRWQHPDKGLIPPSKFIPIAEESGLIVPIADWVLRAASSQNYKWRKEGLPAIPVAVNVSAVQFRQKGFLENIKAALSDTGLDPRYLELELTESVLMRDIEAVIAIVQELNNIGLRLAVDDFGTGYSSLSYLKRLPIHKLKIDQSFVREITTDPDDAAITNTIISMAKNLRIRVIAEGVETVEQLALLRANGCDEAQGYYYSRPLPADQLVHLLREGQCECASSSVNSCPKS